jgi:hypothetical protein
MDERGRGIHGPKLRLAITCSRIGKRRLKLGPFMLTMGQSRREASAPHSRLSGRFLSGLTLAERVLADV